MKSAFYHLFGQQPKKCVVVKTHDDGKVDLAVDEKSAAFVTRCPILSEPKDGHCTNADEPEQKPAILEESSTEEAPADQTTKSKKGKGK